MSRTISSITAFTYGQWLQMNSVVPFAPGQVERVPSAVGAGQVERCRASRAGGSREVDHGVLRTESWRVRQNRSAIQVIDARRPPHDPAMRPPPHRSGPRRGVGYLGWAHVLKRAATPGERVYQ
jgi:hypothetical protein